MDSTAAFSARLDEVGVEDALKNALIAAGIDTLSKFAFCSQPPGQQVDEQAFNDFLNTTLGRAPSVAQGAIARRILFEAHTLMIHSLKEKVEASDQTPIRKMPPAEREDRARRQQTRLAGLTLKGELEVAHCTIDAVNHQLEQKQLKYIAPHKVIKRETEIQGDKPKQHIFLDQGALSFRDAENSIKCDVSSEMQAFNAVQRRALAYDLVSIISYQCSMDFIRFLFDHTHRDSAPGYDKPDLAAVLRADRQAWVLMAENCHDFAPVDGVLKCDTYLAALKSHPEVAFNLLPRPQKRKHQEIEHPGWQNHQTDTDPGKGKHKGKGKGKGKGKRKSPMPKLLIGNWSTNRDGEPLCFNFNLQGCDKAKAGSRCDKGWHLCAKPHCLKAHALPDHGAAKE